MLRRFFNENASACRARARQVRFAKAVTLLAAILSFASPSLAAGDSVVATVGSHQITAEELAAKMKPQLAGLEARIYEMKKRTIQLLADDYLIAEAAKKENLGVEEFLKRHLDGNAVSEADAKKYYDEHKDLQSRFPKYDEIKDRLLQALRKQHESRERTALLERLRKEQPLTVMLAPPRMSVKFDNHPEMGPKDAPVTIVEFADFQCPYCKRAVPTIKQVREKYGDKVRIVFMDFPLGIHDHAMDAAMAARCAADQGKFWPYHDQLFTDPSKLAPADLKQDAKKLGLDSARFDACLDKGTHRSEVEADLKQGTDLGVDGTPAFFINGRPLSGAQPLAKFVSVIDEELASTQKQPNSQQKQASSN